MKSVLSLRPRKDRQLEPADRAEGGAQRCPRKRLRHSSGGARSSHRVKDTRKPGAEIQAERDSPQISDLTRALLLQPAVHLPRLQVEGCWGGSCSV